MGGGLLESDNDHHWARTNPACIVCGSANPKGLQIGFYLQANSICANWIPTGDWESFQNIIHGGIISTVLDEAMSKAIMAHNWEALTVDLRVRFRGRVTPGELLLVCGWVVARQRRKILTEATLTTSEGKERAHAWATFLEPPKS